MAQNDNVLERNDPDDERQYDELIKKAIQVKEDAETLMISNRQVALYFEWEKYTYTVIDLVSNMEMLSNCSMSANRWGEELPYSKQRNSWPGGVATTGNMTGRWNISHTYRDVEENGNKGIRLEIALEKSEDMAMPIYLFSYTILEGSGVIAMGFGMQNHRGFALSLFSAAPMIRATIVGADEAKQVLTLNGAAGADVTAVKSGLDRHAANSLMLTGLWNGKRRTLVWGGLRHNEFGKWANVNKGVLGFKAEDPVGRLVEPGQTYWSDDSFYLDIATADPFEALERYGRAVRTANKANPNVYDFPVLCGWAVGHLAKLPDINNSESLVGELEAAQKIGIREYTKVGIRLEPITYVYASDGNTEQGWWDDEHWGISSTGQLRSPYETFAKWAAAITARDGIPFIHFQVGMPSKDYARAFPGHMLFNRINGLGVYHRHHQPLVSFDYTDPDFQQRILEKWKRLRRDGLRGVKFDFPETGWRPEGGFENKYATTAFAYREVFRLAREGLGPAAFLHERNLGESGRPCLDVTAGLVDTQRTWMDSDDFDPARVTIGGLRWYKNRTVFNYYPDSKALHDLSAGVRQGLITMMSLTSGRIELSTSFTQFTPDMAHDLTRAYPVYREPFSARPLDAFTGVKDPQVYDLQLTPDWHQVALFNTGGKAATISLTLSGDRVTTGSVGLDPQSSYYVYEFWTDSFIGKLSGTGRVERKLDPLNCAMLSIRKVEEHPQVLSTNRHILQGWMELDDVKWDENSKILCGQANVIAGEFLRIILAGNGCKPTGVKANGANAKLESHPDKGLSVLVLNQPKTGRVFWQVDY